MIFLRVVKLVISRHSKILLSGSANCSYGSGSWHSGIKKWGWYAGCPQVQLLDVVVFLHCATVAATAGHRHLTGTPAPDPIWTVDLLRWRECVNLFLDTLLVTGALLHRNKWNNMLG
jgi:hypothetical protein